jgi:Tol biopolymer transport system component
MGRKNQSLIVILVVLAVGVLLTSALTIYLVNARQQENSDPAEPGEDLNLLLASTKPTAAALIAYTTNQSDEDEFSAVYVMDADGGEQSSPSPRRVAGSDQGMCILPSWSPDGQRIAYTTQVPGESGSLWDGDDRMEVWVAAVDGSERVCISDAIPDALMANWIPVNWFPDGTRLAFVTIRESKGDSRYSEYNTLHIARADGSGIEQSIPLPLELRSASLSPAGDELLFVVRESYDEFEQGVYVLSIESQKITQVYGEARVAGWSSDGTEIVVGTDLSQQVLILGPNRRPRWAVELREFPVEIAWSPDGSHIAVGSSSNNVQYTSMALHVIAVGTGEIVTLLDETENFRLDWSPDGSLLLFNTIVGTRQGANLPVAILWVYDVASGELKQLTAGEGYDGMGAWSP